MLRVLIADDHQLTLAAVRGALEGASGIKVVGEASSGRMALGLVQSCSPDVVLLDVNMPGAVDGLTAAERIRRRYPDVRVVMISAASDESSVLTAFRRGAHAYISKAVDPGDIAPAIRQAVSGTVFHAPPGDAPLAAELPEGLSEREASVLKAVAAGLSNAAIAKRLWVSEHTVKFHLTNIFRKLGVKNRTEAAHWAHSHGIVEDIAGEEEAAAEREVVSAAPRQSHSAPAPAFAPAAALAG